MQNVTNIVVVISQLFCIGSSTFLCLPLIVNHLLERINDSKLSWKANESLYDIHSALWTLMTPWYLIILFYLLLKHIDTKGSFVKLIVLD